MSNESLARGGGGAKRRGTVRRLLCNPSALFGLVLFAFFFFVALFAPLVAPHPPNALYAGRTYLPPAWVTRPNVPARSGDPSFPLGTDAIGRDVLSRVIYGARASLAVGLIPLVPVLLIGLGVGLVAGYAGGRVDDWLMRFTDLVYAFPALLFFILLLTALRDTAFGSLLSGLALLFLAFALLTWTTLARLARGQVMAVKRRAYVEAARAVGVPDWRILLRHIVPNALAPVLVAAAYVVPTNILAEAVLSYLGLGLRPNGDPNAVFPTSWGALISEGALAVTAQPALLLAPLVCLLLVLLASTLVADGLQEALDPLT